MKRSEINAIMSDADAFIRQHQFFLPPFAYWTPQEWQKKGPEVHEIVEYQLGWDITDFGSGNFKEIGLFMFTIRNGHQKFLKSGQGKIYAEKLLIVDVNQVTPMHFHWTKMEDIINRGGGKLVIELYNSTPDDQLATTPVTISLDGVLKTVPAGGHVALSPGESITLPTHLYHKFWSEGQRTLVGEVSVVNDDFTDNHFYQGVGRFADIVEDQAPLYLLYNDYKNYYKVQAA
jgi:D-lyxose ketol-isomerase